METMESDLGRSTGRGARADRPDLPPLLVDNEELSRLLRRSVASLRRDDALGRLPAGVKLGASKRWRHAEIVAWVEAGMPHRNAWG